MLASHCTGMGFLEANRLQILSCDSGYQGGRDRKGRTIVQREEKLRRGWGRSNEGGGHRSTIVGLWRLQNFQTIVVNWIVACNPPALIIDRMRTTNAAIVSWPTEVKSSELPVGREGRDQVHIDRTGIHGRFRGFATCSPPLVGNERSVGYLTVQGVNASLICTRFVP